MLAFVAAALLAQTAAADTVGVVDAAFKGTPTRLAVLGSAHLSQFQDGFDRKRLEPLLARIQAWKPDIITVEAPTGRDCERKAARPDLNGWEPAAYCRLAIAARAAAGVDQYAAEAAIAARLAKPAPDRPPAERRRLATLFLAAGEPGSALVQWLRLPAAERRDDEILTPGLAAALGRYATSANETYSIAAEAAARLGLERVYPTDDHSAGDIVSGLGNDYGRAITAIWDNAAAKESRAALDKTNEAMLKGGDIIAYYRLLNAPATLRGQMRADFAAAAAAADPGGYGRAYLAYWETRNLRMVANMRQAFGTKPGARVLSVVGNSHKPYFERYFATQSDVRIVDVAEILK